MAARDEVLELLGASAPASGAKGARRGAAPVSARDEVLSMLTTAPEPTEPLPSRVAGAATEQAGRMGRFFTEGLPQAARVTGAGLQQAATAPTLGTELRRRGAEGGFGERVAFGGLSPIPAVADLAERFMGMYGAVVRGVAELGPEKAKPLTEALLSQAPFIPRAGWSALGQDVRAATGRMPRPGPVSPPPVVDPLAGDPSSVRTYRQPELPPGPRETRALPPAPPEVSGWPETTTATRGLVREPIPQPPVVTPKRPAYEEPPPVIRGTRVAPPEESLLVPRRVERPSQPLRTSEDIAFERAGGDPTMPAERPTRFVDEQGRPILEARPGYRSRTDEFWEAQPAAAEAVGRPPVVSEPSPAAPPRRPAAPEPPPEAPPAAEAAIPEPPPPRRPRPGDIVAGANPEFQAERARWQERLAQIDYGTVNLRDPDEVRAFIKGVGGIRPGRDYPDIPFFFKNRAGRPIDEIVQELANAQRKPVKVVEGQLADTLMRYKALREQKAARRGQAEPLPDDRPPTMQEWEQRVNADPDSAYPEWLRGVVPPIPLPDLPEEEQDTTKGRLYRVLQIVGLGAPAIGMAATIRWRPAQGRGALSSFRSEDQRFRVVQETPDRWKVVDQTSKAEAAFPTFQAARQWAERRGVIPETSGMRYEATAIGDQALIPGSEARAMPNRPVGTERVQRPVEDLPLFGQEKAAREAKAAGAQRSLFDYLKEEQGAIFPRRGEPPEVPRPGRPPSVPAEFRSERVGGGSYRPPTEPPGAPPRTPEPPTEPSLGSAADRPGAADLVKPGALQGLRAWAREFYSPLISQFERMGPAGQEVSRRVQEAESAAQRWYGRNIEPIVREARSLSGPEAESFLEVVERGAQPISPRVEALRRQYERVFGPQGLIPEEAGKRNMVVMDREGEARMFQARKDFFPHEFAPEVAKEIRERGPAYDRAVKHLLDTGQAHDAETAGVMLAERFNFKRTTIGDRIFLMDPDRFVGGLERARDLDLPDYIRDPATAIAARGQKVARRFAELDHYGRLDAEIGAPGGFLDPMTNQSVPAHGLIGEIQRTQGREAATHAHSLFQQALGHTEWQPGLATKQALARGVTSFEAFTKLPTAAIANASQFAQVAARTNLTTAAKGLVASATRAGREAARDLGVISDMSLRQLYEDVLGRQTVGGRAMKVALGPFNVVEKWDRIVGANAGLAWARTLEQRLAGGRAADWMQRELTRLNFAPEEIRAVTQAKALSEEQRSRIAWAIADQTQFLGRRYRRSEFFNTPLGSIIGQFKTYAINAGRLMKRNVLDEAKRGNLAPLARVAVLFPLVGEGVQDVKAIVRGGERPDSPIARTLDNVMAVGGLGLAADFVSSLAKMGKEGALGWLAGPAFTDAMTVAERAYRFGQAVSEGDEEKIGKRARSLGRFAARQIPFAGPGLDTAMREDPKGRQLQEQSIGQRLGFE